MGTGFDLNTSEDNVGIIPRAVRYLFEGINKCKQYSQDNSLPEPTFNVLAQFMELYNEEIYDLFDPTSVSSELMGAATRKEWPVNKYLHTMR